MGVAVKNNLENELYTPPQVWMLMVNLGHMQAIRDDDPNMWVDLTIARLESLLHGFILDHRALLKGDLR